MTETNMVELKLRMTTDHKRALIQALDIVFRAGMGQLHPLGEMFGFDDDSESMWDRCGRLESAVKAVLFPELAGFVGAYYGIRNEKTPRTAKLALELYEAIQNSSWKCEGLSGLPLPEAECSERDEDPLDRLVAILREQRIKLNCDYCFLRSHGETHIFCQAVWKESIAEAAADVGIEATIHTDSNRRTISFSTNGFHPLTCGNDRGDGRHRAFARKHGGDLGQLIPVHDGWLCPTCGWKQGKDLKVLSKGDANV